MILQVETATKIASEMSEGADWSAIGKVAPVVAFLVLALIGAILFIKSERKSWVKRRDVYIAEKERLQLQNFETSKALVKATATSLEVFRQVEGNQEQNNRDHKALITDMAILKERSKKWN